MLPEAGGLSLSPARYVVLCGVAWCGVDRRWVLLCLPDKVVGVSFFEEQYKERPMQAQGCWLLHATLQCCLLPENSRGFKKLKCCLAGQWRQSIFPLVQGWPKGETRTLLSTVTNSNDDIAGRGWRVGVLSGDQVRRDWLGRERCVSRGCRLGLASGRWRRGSLNNLTKPQPPDYGHVPGRMHDSCSGQKGA